MPISLDLSTWTVTVTEPYSGAVMADAFAQLEKNGKPPRTIRGSGLTISDLRFFCRDLMVVGKNGPESMWGAKFEIDDSIPSGTVLVSP